jgi:hypothetical protein
MALTYEQSAALMVDQIFHDRVKVACLKYATYILDEAPTMPAHNTRIKWAQNCMIGPDGAANLVIPTVVMDSAVQDAGVDAEGHSQITDTALQSAVENAVNKLM